MHKAIFIVIDLCLFQSYILRSYLRLFIFNFLSQSSSWYVHIFIFQILWRNKHRVDLFVIVPRLAEFEAMAEKLASMWLLFTIYFILVYSSEEWVLISVELGYHWQQFLQKNMKKRGFLTSSAFLYSSCRCVPNEKLMCNTYLIFDLIIYSAKHSTLRWNVKKYLVPVA